MQHRLFSLLALALAWAALTAGSARADDFQVWLQGVRAEARTEGVRERTLDAAFADLSPIPRVIELDRKQPETTLTFTQYIERVVTPRVQRARQRYAENAALLEEVGRRYGVQPRFIVALWGIETDFGRITGGFPVIGALATLAYDERRGPIFRKQLIEALHILDEGHVTPGEMQGSWAGAMGQTQFIPSSFRRFAVDHDGDGRRDIWSTPADVFASAANYLARSGWNAAETWGREVKLPADFDRRLIDSEERRPVSDWSALGVRRADGGDLPQSQIQATLLSGERDGSGPYFLIYDNFRVLLKWNRSRYFAIAVGRLSDAIQAGF